MMSPITCAEAYSLAISTVVWRLRRTIQRAISAKSSQTLAASFKAMAGALLAASMLGGCSTSKPTQTRFYVLDAMSTSVAAAQDADRDPSLTIDIAALRLPQYLQRPQIVTRTASNELKLSEYHQWGGNLAKNMMRITARNLSRLLGTAQITVFSRRPPKAPDIRVEIDVIQFERGPDSRVVLSAQWRIRFGRGDGSALARISDLYSEPLAAKAPIDITVRAMSELMAQLASRIATAIATSRQ